MAKNSTEAYGASGKTNVLNFEPERLHLVTDTAHPLYDERIHLPLDETMVLNIMDQGVLEPIIVWKDPETGLSCVVDGRQRVRHTVEANKRLADAGKALLLVPAVTKRGSAIRMAQAMISANEIRRADTPLGRAKKMADALDRGHDEEDLSLMFGVGVQTIRATLALLDATQAVKDAVESGDITVTQRASWLTSPRRTARKVKEVEAATAGTKGHEKPGASAVIGDAKPRMKSRKEIMKALEGASGDYAQALRWVLGDDE